MSTIRERLDELKTAKGIPSDSDLLRKIYQDMCKEGRVRPFVNEEVFVDNHKGSFSQMIKGERYFDPELMLSIERVLETSMHYLLDNYAGEPKKKRQRGLWYCAVTDSRANYEHLIDEGVYLEQDEYQRTLLDYMIENDSKVGLEFFAERDELPLNDVGEEKHGFCLRTSNDCLLQAIIRLCSPKTVLKYLNGYHFAENGDGASKYNEERLLHIVVELLQVFAKEELRKEFINVKRIPLTKANPNLHINDSKMVNETVFVNFFFTLMLKAMPYSLPFETLGENWVEEYGHIVEEAMRLNEIAMAAILKLGYSRYQMDDFGYVYAGDLRIVCGSIVPYEVQEEHLIKFPKNLQSIFQKWRKQTQDFYERITSQNKVSIYNNELQLQKQSNHEFYDFYRLMNERGYRFIPKYLEEKSEKKDCISLPIGEQVHLPSREFPILMNQALSILSEIDTISEEFLGKGKIYAFPEIDNRSFYAFGEKITGLVPIFVFIGKRYDNLAGFLACTYLFTPQFYNTEQLVNAFAEALKAYGINKKTINDALECLEEAFKETEKRYDAKNPYDIPRIAEAEMRCLWVNLFKDQIKAQFNK